MEEIDSLQHHWKLRWNEEPFTEERLKEEYLPMLNIVKAAHMITMTSSQFRDTQYCTVELEYISALKVLLGQIPDSVWYYLQKIEYDNR